MKRIKWIPIVLIAMTAVGSYFGCSPSSILSSPEAESNETNLGLGAPNEDAPAGRPVSTAADSPIRTVRGKYSPPPKSPQTILVASFNIQVFGKKKAENTHLLNQLAEVIRQFDVVAIQEVRDESQRSVPKLVQAINSTGVYYDYLLGPPLGRTSSKEQYTYIYDTAKLLASQDACYTVNDGHPGQKSNQQHGDPNLQDLLHREPFVARFVTKASNNAFHFSLVDIHTDPDEIATELDVLADVFRQVRIFEYAEWKEDDVILLGDLNASPEKFGKLGELGLQYAIKNEPTNVKETKLYDNILFDHEMTNEFTGRAGVLRLKDFFSLSMQDAEKISDHNPIWAEFNIQEQPNNYSQMANRSGYSPR